MSLLFSTLTACNVLKQLLAEDGITEVYIEPRDIQEDKS